jgi:hypothetical protein
MWLAEQLHSVIVMVGGLRKTPQPRPQPGQTVYVRLEEVAYGLVVREDVMSFWVGHDSLHLTAYDPDGHPRHLLLRMYPRDPQQHGYPKTERPAQLLVGAAEVN